MCVLSWPEEPYPVLALCGLGVLGQKRSPQVRASYQGARLELRPELLGGDWCLGPTAINPTPVCLDAHCIAILPLEGVIPTG